MTVVAVNVDEVGLVDELMDSDFIVKDQPVGV